MQDNEIVYRIELTNKEYEILENPMKKIKDQFFDKISLWLKRKKKWEEFPLI